MGDLREVQRIECVEKEVAIHGRVVSPAGRKVPNDLVNAMRRSIRRKKVVVRMLQLVVFRSSLIDLRPRQPASRACIGPIPSQGSPQVTRTILTQMAYLEGPPLTDLDCYGA